MEKYTKKWQSVIDYCSKYLSHEKKGWLCEYLDVGEPELAFELIVGFVMESAVPLSRKLFEWIQWYGSESEKMGIEVNPDWKKIKL